MLLLTSLSLLLSLTSSVSTKNVPAPAHLGEISILAADDLTCGFGHDTSKTWVADCGSHLQHFEAKCRIAA